MNYALNFTTCDGPPTVAATAAAAGYLYVHFSNLVQASFGTNLRWARHAAVTEDTYCVRNFSEMRSTGNEVIC